MRTAGQRPLEYIKVMERSPHILVVDDHTEIREPLVKYLRKNGMRSSAAECGRTMRKALETSAVDLIVLDIMMPGESGLDLCRYIREATDIPVIFLTAMVDDNDKIEGLELGADDYVTKPFNARELFARIKAVLRRTETLPGGRTPANETYVFEGWRLRVHRQELCDPGGVVVPVSGAEFRLLTALVERAGLVLSRDQLLDLTAGREARIFDRSIDNQISRLRKKIEPDPRLPSLIKTVRGDGYVFAGDVEKGHP